MSLYIFDILLYYYICLIDYHIFMTSPLWLAVGPQSLEIRRIIYTFLDVCPFDNTAVAVSGKVERS